MRRMETISMLVLLGACACGSTQKPAAATAAGQPAPAAAEAAPAASSDQLDSLNDLFRRRANVIADSCYSPELSKNRSLQGDVTVKMMVQPDGTPTEVTVSGSTLHDATVEACIVSQVSSWHLPQLNGSLPWSWTYHFEPAY